jgi:peptidyl-prolyl cis-trans isomerase SurA
MTYEPFYFLLKHSTQPILTIQKTIFGLHNFFMKKFLLFVFIILSVAELSAQPPVTKKVVADKIVGQVGDRIILRSDILDAISDYKRRGQEESLPENPECAFLEGQLIQKALVIQAEKDSLPVSDDDVEAALENQIRGFIRQYGSKDVLEEVAGKTIYQIKEDFRQSFKERKLADAMRSKIVDNIKITPTEVKAYFDKIPKDSLFYYESEIEISQIILNPKANKDVEDFVVKQLYDYKRQADAGTKKFEQLAKLFSDDKGTESQGGTLTINRTDRSGIDQDFLRAAFKLKDGQISPVIKSKFGYHIIKMQSRNGDEAVVRHILLIPAITQEEIDIQLHKLDTIRNGLVEKKYSFGAAVTAFSEDENSKFNGGQIQRMDGSGSSYLTLDQLPDKEMVLAIKNLKPGEYAKPQVFEERGAKKVRLLYLKSRTNPHKENVRDDYNKIAQRALEDKKQTALIKWFKEHLPNYYIMIDKEYKDCLNLNDWWKYAALH